MTREYRTKALTGKECIVVNLVEESLNNGKSIIRLAFVDINGPEPESVKFKLPQGFRFEPAGFIFSAYGPLPYKNDRIIDPNGFECDVHGTLERPYVLAHGAYIGPLKQIVLERFQPCGT